MSTPDISEGARRAAEQICEIQQRRMDETFHINAENARAMFESIIQTALDSAHPAPTEGIRRVKAARDFLCDCVEKSPLFDNWANRFAHAQTLLNHALEALESLHPAPMEGGETPETDAAFLPGEESVNTMHDAEMFARSLERRLAEKTREVNNAVSVLRAAMGDEAMDGENVYTMCILLVSQRDNARACENEYRTQLTASEGHAMQLQHQLQKANELLGEAHRCYFDPGHMEPNTWGTEVAHKLDDYFRAHLNQQTK